METRATARTVLVVPRKARLVINLVRGKNVDEANAILTNLNKKSARLVKKVLNSATANAENNFKLDRNNLYVKEAFVRTAADVFRKGTKSSNAVGVDPRQMSGSKGGCC